MTTTCVASELLCYYQNNVANTAKNILISSLCGFYEQDEVSEAKALLFTTAENIKANGLVIDLPRKWWHQSRNTISF